MLALVLWTLVAEKKEGVPLLALRALDKGEERRRGVREDGGALPPAGGVAGGRLAEEGGAQDELRGPRSAGGAVRERRGEVASAEEV